MRTIPCLALALSLVACGGSTPPTTDEDEAAAQEFGERLQAVLEHPERALVEEDRMVVIATIRHMEDFPLDEELAPLIRALLSWSMQTTEVHVVGCASLIPLPEGSSEQTLPARLAMTYYVLELVAFGLEHPELSPRDDSVQLRAITIAVRVYASARDRIGRDPALDALETRIDAGELAPWYAAHNGCDQS